MPVPWGCAVRNCPYYQGKSTHCKANYVFRGEWGRGMMRGKNKSISLEGRGISSWFTEPGASVFHIGFQRRSWRGQWIGPELGCPPTERRAENTRLLHVGVAWQGRCTETPLKAWCASQGCGQKKKVPTKLQPGEVCSCLPFRWGRRHPRVGLAGLFQKAPLLS